VSQHRNVAAFDDRAPGYDQGWLGQLHHEIAQRTAAMAQAADRAPRGVLDVGCGTGYLLRLLVARYPESTELAGIDPAHNMIETASATASGGWIKFGSPSVSPSTFRAPMGPLTSW